MLFKKVWSSHELKLHRNYGLEEIAMRHFVLIVIAFVLSLYGAMLLRDIPRGLTAHKYVETGKVANMTLEESVNSNAVKNNGIRMEIIVPELVVITIPENKPGVSTPVKLDVNISNHTSTRIPINIIGTLIPELVAPNGQAVERQEPRERHLRMRDAACSFIRPGEVIGNSLEARLIWQNNVLKLEIPNSPEYFWEVPLTSDNYWSFSALNSGTYQFRFIYDSLTAATSCLDPETEQPRRVEDIDTGRLATPSINLNLVQPTATNPNAVEVDGIRFETVMPERVLTLPEIGSKARTPVQLGIRITNNTTTPLYFNCFDAIFPSMMGVNRSYAMDWLGSARESDFPLALPGESVTFFPGVSLLCLEDERCVLLLATDDGGVWQFGTVKSGIYRIQFEYINKVKDLKFYNPEMRRSKRIENVCTGLVSLPSVEFSLVGS